MLFRRRNQPDFLTRVREAAWPRRSWSRSAKYFAKRVLRLSGSPHAIAAGVAAGAFAAFTPFIGFHFVIAIALAFVIGGNLLAAALGTAAIGNPLTFPFIWAGTYGLGKAILHADGRDIAAGDLPGNFAEKSIDAVLPFIRPMVVGAVPLGLAAAVIVYIAAYVSVATFQRLRRERLAERRRAAFGPEQPKPVKISEPA
jgi:uncharacterized protein (DUF2062 family)